MKAYYQCYQRSLLGVFWLSACNLNFLLPPLSLNHINTNKVHLGGVEKLNRTLYKKTEFRVQRASKSIQFNYLIFPSRERKLRKQMTFSRVCSELANHRPKRSSDNLFSSFFTKLYCSWQLLSAFRHCPQTLFFIFSMLSIFLQSL